MRLDQYLAEQNLFASREKARAAIMAGIVFVDGEKADKPGENVADGVAVEVRGSGIPYVSRGGLKLEKALAVFGASPAGKVCMDIGASTGGFTDCMLQNGAAHVYAVDVGYGQLAWALRNDERVTVMERTNARNLTENDVADKIDFFTIDVSFISLKLILPAVRRLAAATCDVVCLVKPQFEAGREKVGKNGVVSDEKTHREVLQKAVGYAAENRFRVLGLNFSPVKGPKGNIEFLMLLHGGTDGRENGTAGAAGKAEGAPSASEDLSEDLAAAIAETVRAAHAEL